jgi:hypothetical protein
MHAFKTDLTSEFALGTFRECCLLIHLVRFELTSPTQRTLKNTNTFMPILLRYFNILFLLQQLMTTITVG